MIICENPKIQAFNAIKADHLLSFIHCKDPVNSTFSENPLAMTNIDHFYFEPLNMKRPVVFNIKHSWKVFRITEESEDEAWIYDLSGKWLLQLTRKRNGDVVFQTGWVAKIAIDFQDAVNCIQFILSHPSFVLNVPLPHHFDVGLLTEPLRSDDHASKVCTLAIIAMGIRHSTDASADGSESVLQISVCLIGDIHICRCGCAWISTSVASALQISICFSQKPNFHIS
ncbi:uncharacterized protein ARMOST_20362 [Armillaria ostoyae]|uniref:Uncharacterized protein n=1 Tax=Armillaria ostoyae TaxID=47428 RepID=A0A284S758_ARMOS|nr:uncharacterized protein ARMOST_20362 [Armillaria ostoyae]